MEGSQGWSRNPFFFSGHFNFSITLISEWLKASRNPFFFSGHFNKPTERTPKTKTKTGRNPFFFSGHFTLLVEELRKKGLPAGRNPFFFSGHFNLINHPDFRVVEREGVAIPSFFQGISTWLAGEGRSYYSSVAIPSFFQGISTISQKNIKVEIPPPVAIPSFFQGISTLFRGRENNIHTLSQSLLFFRAFQHLIISY